MENSKLIKSAAVFDRILKIVQGFLLAGVIVAAVFILLTAIFGEKIIADSSTLTLGQLKLTLSGTQADYLDIGRVKLSLFVMLASEIVALAAGWYCLKKLRGVLAPMKEGRPFEQGSADRIRKLGWVVLICGGVAEIGVAVGKAFELMAYDISFLKGVPEVADVSVIYNINLWFVAVALLVFFLSYIFRYGETLQQESDETL